MREFKFRAWDPANAKMIHVKQLTERDSLCSIDDYNLRYFDYPLMQYTGLKDKKTLTCIYEGDIIDMEGNIRGNIYETPEVYKTLTNSVVAGMGYDDWENTKQRLVRQGKLVAEQSNLPQILRELG